MIFIRSLVIVASKIIFDSIKGDYIAFDRPNAPDYTRAPAHT
jgi:hypothetical protein